MLNPSNPDLGVGSSDMRATTYKVLRASSDRLFSVNGLGEDQPTEV